MTPIDEQLVRGAAALQDGMTSDGPGPKAIAARSRQRRRRRAGAAVVVAACVGLTAWIGWPGSTSSVDMAAPNVEVTSEAIQSCRSDFEQSTAERRNQYLADEGLDLRSIDVELLEAIAMSSPIRQTTGVVLRGSGVDFWCGRFDGGGSTSLLPNGGGTELGPAEIRLRGVDFDLPHVVLMGEVGSEVVSIDVSHEGSEPVAGQIENGWFLVAGEFPSTEVFLSIAELEFNWTLSDGSTSSVVGGEAFGPSSQDAELARDRAVEHCIASLGDAIERADPESELGQLDLANAGPVERRFEMREFGFTRLVPLLFENGDALYACLATEGGVLESQIVVTDPFAVPGDRREVWVGSAAFGIQTDTDPSTTVGFVVGTIGYDVRQVNLVLPDGTVLPAAVKGQWFIVTGAMPAGLDADDVNVELFFDDDTMSVVPLSDLPSPPN